MYKNRQFNNSNFYDSKESVESAVSSNTDRKEVVGRFSKPGKPEQPKVDTAWVISKLSDIKYGNSLTVPLNPSDQVAETPTIYPIINKMNPVLVANYKSGKDNLSGNIIDILLTSNNTGLQSQFDTVNTKIVLNYQFLNLTDKTTSDTPPVENNKYYFSAYNEALSTTASEMFTQLPYPSSTVETKVPGADIQPLALPLIWYQTVLQNLALVFAKYVQLRTLETELINMGFQREASDIIQLMGMFKKKTFTDIPKAISTKLTGEYFDKDWYKIVNPISNVASRRSYSMKDPLVTINAVHQMPTLKVKANGMTTPWLNTEDYVENGKSFQTWFEELIDLLDQQTLLKFCRDRYNGKSTEPINTYYNNVVKAFQAIGVLMNKFSKEVNDIRTYIDVARRANLNNWTKGITFDIDAKPGPIGFNTVIHDLTVQYNAGPSELIYNDTTCTWLFYTPWSEMTGIPSYDRYQSGAFLAFSLRKVIPSTISGITGACVPKLFNVTGSTRILSMNSAFYEITRHEVEASSVLTNPFLGRLFPLDSMNKIKIRVPSIDMEAKVLNSERAASTALQLINRMFDFGQVRQVTKSGSSTTTETRATVVSDDLICFVDGQINSLSDEMVNYFRTHCAFRVWNDSTLKSNIGLKG